MKEIEKDVLSALPNSAGGLQAKFQGKWHWRQIDRALQKLRKDGLISWLRHGRLVTWDTTEAGHARLTEV